jgi:serine/threonine-protein kinase
LHSIVLGTAALASSHLSAPDATTPVTGGRNSLRTTADTNAAMDPRERDTWRSADRAFEALLEVDETQREAALAAMSLAPEVADRVRRLLAADSGDAGMLDRPLSREHPAVAGRRLGPWILEHELGRGGMAVVWRARHAADPERLAAVKVLTVGELADAGLERFRREQRVLARLDHPHIATLVDSGVEPDGTPWLAMRLVEGQRIDAWCRERCLDARARVRLLLDVAGAVAFAHRNLVVHRDIKPSNVLVDADGHVRLLDFGIARLVDDTRTEATATVHRALSPPYASPQQFAGLPASTADDVFGLGALLYVLLAGVPPRRDRDPRVTDVPPSRVPRPADGRAALPDPREVRGDLDAIAMRALAALPTARYPSVEALAEDLDRWLAGRPVRARGVGWLYRTRRFLVRHWAVASLSAIAILSLIAGTWVALDRAQIAEAERARAEAVQDFLLGIFAANQSDASGNYVLSRREIATEAARRLAAADAAGETVDPALSLGLSRVLHLVGLRDEAQFRAEAARAALGPAHPDAPLSIDAAVRLAELRADQGDRVAAEALYREALAAMGRRPVVERIAIEGKLAMALYYQQRIEEAAELSDRHFAWLEVHGGSVPTDLHVDLLLDRTVILRGLGRLDDAQSTVDRALREAESAFGPDNPRLVRILDTKGTIENRRGRARAAIDTQRRAVALAGKVAGSINGGRLGNLARSLLILGDANEARSVARQGLELRREEVEPGHRLDYLAREPLIRAEAEFGRLDQAIAFYDEWLAVEETDPGSTRRARRRLDRAMLLLRAGRLPEAQAELLDITRLASPIFPARVVRAGAHIVLSRMALDAGDPEGAANALAHARAEIDLPQMELEHRILLVEAEARLDEIGGRRDAAVASLSGFDRELAEMLGDDSPRRARFQLGLAAMLDRAGRRDEARSLRTGANAVLERHGLAADSYSGPPRSQAGPLAARERRP